MLALRTRAAASSLALVAVLAAGCGTDKKQSYAQNVQTAADRFKGSVEKAGAQVRSGSSLKARVPALTAFRGSVDKLASDLDGLDPPANAKRANDDAVRQLRTLSGDLGGYESAARAGAASKARQIAPRLQADQTLLQKTLSQLDAQTGK